MSQLFRHPTGSTTHNQPQMLAHARPYGVAADAGWHAGAATSAKAMLVCGREAHGQQQLRLVWLPWLARLNQWRELYLPCCCGDDGCCGKRGECGKHGPNGMCAKRGTCNTCVTRGKQDARGTCYNCDVCGACGKCGTCNTCDKCDTCNKCDWHNKCDKCDTCYNSRRHVKHTRQA